MATLRMGGVDAAQSPEATEKPRYRVLEGNFYTGGPKARMLYPGDVVAFNGEPNMNLEPLNASAKAKMTAFLADRNQKSAEFTKKMADDKGVYVSAEVYRQRSFDEEQDAMPTDGGEGRLMGSAPDPDETEVIFQGPPPGTVAGAQPGAVTGMVHSA